MGYSKAYIKLTDGATISIKDASLNSYFYLTEIQSRRLDVSWAPKQNATPTQLITSELGHTQLIQVSLACRGQLILGELSQKRSAHPKRAQPKELGHTTHSLS